MKLVQAKMSLIFRYWMTKLLQIHKEINDRGNHDEYGDEIRRWKIRIIDNSECESNSCSEDIAEDAENSKYAKNRKIYEEYNLYEKSAESIFEYKWAITFFSNYFLLVK